METATVRLLALWKASQGIESDHVAWQKLGLSGQSAISNWRHGRSHATAVVVQRMAKEADQDAGAWLMEVQADRATSAEEKKVWRSLARRLGAAAGLAAVALLLREHGHALIAFVAAMPLNDEAILHYAKCRCSSRCCW